MNIKYIFKSKLFFTIFILGFLSGLPLPLTASTLTVWLSEYGVSKTVIGLFASAGLPYSLKFLWAPFIDKIRLPILFKMFNHRKSWMILLLFLLCLSTIIMALYGPDKDIKILFFIIFIFAFISSSFDVVVDAYRIENCNESELPIASSLAILGYRISMLVSSAGALYLAEIISWTYVYIAISGIFLLGIIFVIFIKEHKAYRRLENHSFTQWCKSVILAPFIDFATRKYWLLILIFIVSYKICDALAGMMTNVFLLDLHFTKSDIASIVKTFGLFATLLGFVIGGFVTRKIGPMYSLMIFGIGQILSNLMFVWQNHMGNDKIALAITIGVENITSAMANIALITYLSLLCKKEFSGTQYALLSAIAALGRVTLTSASGYLVDLHGYSKFFYISAAAGIPSLILLMFIITLNKKGKI